MIHFNSQYFAIKPPLSMILGCHSLIFGILIVNAYSIRLTNENTGEPASIGLKVEQKQYFKPILHVNWYSLPYHGSINRLVFENHPSFKVSVDGDDFIIIKIKIYLTWQPPIMVSVLLPELAVHLHIITSCMG
jgi:hypothetical protein